MAVVTPRATPIVALDVASAPEALKIVHAVGSLCRFYKIGLELFTAEGPDVVRAVRETGSDVFLDLKLHDIPNTVRGAARSAARLGVRLLTVHGSGGRAMIEAAVEGAASAASVAGPGCEILAVSVLTSMRAADLEESWGRATGDLDVRAEVLRLAGLARTAGAHGVVCSGAEVRPVRDVYGDSLALLVPGIRFAGEGSHDQARVVAPRDAVEAGARYLVLGRAVTSTSDMAAAMRRALDEMA